MRVVFFLSPVTGRKFWALILVFFLLLFTAVLAVWTKEKNRPVNAGGLPLPGKTIVIDPGHGGYDPGVWRNNVEEKEIALAVSLALRDWLQSAGARVMMTRETDKDLLVPVAGPKKTQDMQNRLKIVRSAKPDLFISIHANSISSSRWRGAQVFYKPDGEKSKALAEYIQQELIRVLANTTREVKPGNYLVLNESEVPAVLVETGFISNPDEVRLLCDPKYRAKLAWAVYLGINRYYSSPVSRE